MSRCCELRAEKIRVSPNAYTRDSAWLSTRLQRPQRPLAVHQARPDRLPVEKIATVPFCRRLASSFHNLETMRLMPKQTAAQTSTPFN